MERKRRKGFNTMLCHRPQLWKDTGADSRLPKPNPWQVSRLHSAEQRRGDFREKTLCWGQGEGDTAQDRALSYSRHLNIHEWPEWRVKRQNAHSLALPT